MSLSERADARFLWNKHLLQEFSHYEEFSKYCLSLLQGFISINHCTVNGNSFKWTLISRRSILRAGARLIDFQIITFTFFYVHAYLNLM